MNHDKKMKELIKNGIDTDLQEIKFHQVSKDEVLKRITKEQGLIKRIMEYEIVIPLKPLVAATAALFIGIGYLTYPIFKIDKQDLTNSTIQVVKLDARRYDNEGY